MITPTDSRLAARQLQKAGHMQHKPASKAAFWIDDPFGSLATGIAIPSAAVGVAAASIWGIVLTLV